ncbi:tomoregulin-1 [Denticeps clupeoides]|uniref:tomoregulin-1 n=1 Tax=Denticeps clupeoides TaxID=299321 RepID=UPI0010A43DF0|nr:tomoregulin-1-like [Denticeps clupeoides]
MTRGAGAAATGVRLAMLGLTTLAIVTGARSSNPDSSECPSEKDCADAAEKKSDLRVCDESTCRYGGTCRDEGGQVKCACQFQCSRGYVPVCGSNGDTYQNECYLRQAACKQQTLISMVTEGPCNPDHGSGSGDGEDDGSGSDPAKKFTKCGTCKYGAECDEDSEDVWCICNIDCSGHNENAVCGTDGRSYSNPCLLREASCMKQEQIDVKHLGKCSDVAEQGGVLSGMPCDESHRDMCVHGTCEMKNNIATCRCDVGFSGQRCEGVSVMYVVPSGQRLHYVLIAGIIAAAQIATICAVVMCIARKCPKNPRARRQKHPDAGRRGL